jgi:hypothetical protein
MDKFTESYIGTALWCTSDEDNVPLDEWADSSDLAPETLKEIEEDCKLFQEEFGHLFKGFEELAGHDFYLTRNRHGAGFWDGDWDKDIAKVLTQASHNCGSFFLYPGDDSKIYHY